VAARFGNGLLVLNQLVVVVDDVAFAVVGWRCC